GKQIEDEIQLFKSNGINRICLHYGYFFNADYQSVLAYTEFLIKRFSGDLYCFSPEELVYLSIIAHKDIDEIISDFKRIGVQKLLGFLPKSIIESSFYAEDDELLIEDRHIIFEKLLTNGIDFDYPFNPSQIETAEELEEIVSFVERHQLKKIIIQPNRPIDSDYPFNYEQAQFFASELFADFAIPLIEIKRVFDFYTGNGAYQFYRINDGQLVAYDFLLATDPRVKNN
ncbi:MAG: hypothetical protein KDD94_02320, partial [Calditrichaeota bacterium]|nr:hypothetical protein [Calditrichota bacterium]